MQNIQDQLINAYLQLLKDNSPQQITVKQIVAQANVSRSTFYLYFEQKEQLHTTLQNYVRGQFLMFYHGEPSDRHGEFTTYFLCKHVLKYRNYYRWAFQQPEEIHYLCKELEKYLEKVYEDVDYSIFASYGTIGYLKKWVEDEFLISPSEAAEKLMKIGFTNWADSVRRVI